MKNQREINISQEYELAKLRNKDSRLKMRWDSNLKSPALLSGKMSEPVYGVIDKVAVEAAKEFLEEHKSLLRMRNPKSELTLINKVTDIVGNTSVAMQQNYKGIPVDGGTVRVQFDTEKIVNRVTNKYQTDIDIDTKPKIDVEQAVKAALKDAGQGKLEDEYTPTLSIFQYEGKLYLVWNIFIDDIEHEKLFHYFINAHDGTVVFKYNNFQTGQGTGYYSGSGSINSIHDASTYKLIDTSRVASGGPEIRTCDLDGGNDNPGAVDGNVSEDLNDNWNNATTSPRKDSQGAEVDVHRYLGNTVDYYKTVHGWNSYDNAGSTIYVGIHLGTNYNNAYYRPNQNKFYFGDGDNSLFDYLTPQDVVSHEFTHAVTAHTSRLNYYNQSGGLNESFSDIFAAFIDSDDTDIGEECTTPGFPGDALRRMSNPSDSGAVAQIPNHVLASLDTMGTGYYNGQDPHSACGPMIYAAYFMLHGGTHPNSNVSVGAIGYTKTEKIMWHVQSIGLLGNNNATFLECREAALNAVDSLLQTDPNYLNIMDSVKNAFTAVGIGADIYIRDSLTDMGTIPSIGTLYRSPDIITRIAQVANPSSTLGDMTRDDLAENVEAGQDNYVYVRLQNRGSVAGDVTINLYWSAPSTFSAPSSWHPIGSVDVNNIQPNTTEIPEIVWDQSDLPVLGHFCIVAELDDPSDPAPDKSLITTGSMFTKFISESNNFSWKNIQVVDVLPMGLTSLEFFIRSGSENENAEIRFEVQELPNGTETYVRILRRLCEGAEMIGMEFDKANTRYAYYKLQAGKICYMRNVPFKSQDESEVQLYVKVPNKINTSYEVAVAQYFNGGLTGRITHVLNVLNADEFDFTGNRNSREVHKKGCIWIDKMSESNKTGFRTLKHAHMLGYDNCAFCLGDSNR